MSQSHRQGFWPATVGFVVVGQKAPIGWLMGTLPDRWRGGALKYNRMPGGEREGGSEGCPVRVVRRQRPFILEASFSNLSSSVDMSELTLGVSRAL
jgi:hypothetical protein